LQSFTIRITGTAPLLMHNGRLSDPIDPATQALAAATSKRKKTIDDYREVSRLEHAGGLYLDPDIGPYLPGENIARALLDAARMNRQGKNVERGLFITSDVNPLAYKGPRDLNGLWADENFQHRKSAKVGQQRIVRTRPMFRQWSCEAEGAIDTQILDVHDLRAIIERAGLFIGLGDWRPRFGRFTGELTTTGEIAA
jgi:hypothetical protein